MCSVQGGEAGEGSLWVLRRRRRSVGVVEEKTEETVLRWSCFGDELGCLRFLTSEPFTLVQKRDHGHGHHHTNTNTLSSRLDRPASQPFTFNFSCLSSELTLLFVLLSAHLREAGRGGGGGRGARSPRGKTCEILLLLLLLLSFAASVCLSVCLSDAAWARKKRLANRFHLRLSHQSVLSPRRWLRGGVPCPPTGGL